MTAESKSKTHHPKKNALLNYFEESYQELRKVTWPTRSQAVRLSFLVLGCCVATAIFIGILDFIFSYGYETLVNLAPPAPTAITEQNPASLQVTPVAAPSQTSTVKATPATEPSPPAATPSSQQ